ncbi:M48 family metalloprotease [Pseudoalteromonas aurantia]|uniref:Putative beta-barrel assembly-enhancing protease n=2 Tax=Pseudoalteromonas TaxID=53246 RepID=A0A5S3VAW9_9GAMM|nr:M48 family metalloprotease [Pseudoalteromonas aurantia]TMO59796.1 protease [Pseudoalteromonas aurantia]TMO68658.1 protease [Pseudoalteromonas aurantia]TMO74981.1 protease [Pseudoalteromonas aurantia]
MTLKRVFACAVSAGLLISSSLTYAQSNFKLPDLGTSALQALPLEKEKAIGEVMMMQIRSGSPLLQDPVLDEYLTSLGNRLVANANDVRFPFTFFWINNPAINAFAFYGGHVGVHSGLIAQSDNESQFASVLGHEIAHVTQRHLARRLQQAQDNSALTIAGMITGILATVIAPDAGMAIIAANSTQAALSQLTHSRKAEQEADRIGMQTLHNAGFDTTQSAEFLSKLAAQMRFKNKPPVFLLTHPLPDSRVSDVRLRAQQYASVNLPESPKFQLAKSRVLARNHYTSEDAQAYFEKQIKQSSKLDDSALEYGLALSLLDQKKYQLSGNLIVKLLKKEPDNLFYLDAYTDILIGQKKAVDAVKILHKKHEFRPNNQVITLNYANAAIEAKQYDKAEQLLKIFLLDKPEHTLAIELLSKVYKQQDHKSAYHEVKASLLAQYGAYIQAADEIQRALNHVEKKETVKESRLKALLSQYRQMQKELAKL